MQQNSLQKSKGGRKRLNSQAAENVEKRRSVNLNKCEMQVYKLFTLVLLCIIGTLNKCMDSFRETEKLFHAFHVHEPQRVFFGGQENKTKQSALT